MVRRRSPGRTRQTPTRIAEGDDEQQNARAQADVVWNDNTTFISFCTLIGINRQYKLQSAIFAVCAFFLIFGGCVTSSLIALVLPLSHAPRDFAQKGTLSNVSQDLMSPHGRLWSTALVVGAILNMVSMYPFWLYRCWAPWSDDATNPLRHPTFQTKQERLVRTCWVVFPSVGFILAGIIPAISNADGFYRVLTAVHNVAAPVSMLFCMIMETIQLHFGEAAVCSRLDAASVHARYTHGPVGFGQRMRVRTLVATWVAGTAFVAVQAYLALFDNQQYWLAQLSFVSEVVGILGHFAMPALGAVEYLIGMEGGSVMDEAKVLIGVLAAPPVNS